MSNKYKINDTAFLLESNRIIRKGIIVNFSGGLYTVRFANGTGGIKVRESRLFSTKEEAEAAIPKPKPKTTPSYPTPWD